MKNGIYASMFGFAVTATAALAPMAALFMPAAVWANGAGEGFHRGGHMWGGGGHMFFGPLMMILVIAVVVVIVVLIVRWMGGGLGGPSTPVGKSPQDILKERYARGEMTTKEFEERRKVLGD